MTSDLDIDKLGQPPREAARRGRADPCRHEGERHAGGVRPGQLCGVEAGAAGGGGVAGFGAGAWNAGALRE